MSIPFIDLKTQYQTLKSEIDHQIQRVLDHGQFIMGPEVVELEKGLTEFTGAKHAITCSSGTDAAVIALMALGLKPGEEVIVPAFSFIATAESVILAGGNPVMIDIDPHTYNMNPELIEKAITSKTHAIMPVSLYGQPAEMDEINAIASKHNLFVIEDAAQSFGSIYKGKRSCSLSHIGVTSFFPAKPLGCYGDGGACFTSDDTLAQAMREVRFHGQTDRYYHTRIGMNGRMDTLQCAIMLPKLKKFSWELDERQKLADHFNEAFRPLTDKGVKLPLIKSDRRSAWAQYTLWVPEREAFQKRLQELGVPTAVHYPRTMSDQPAYTDWKPQWSVAESERAARHVVSLPMHPYMDDSTRDRIISAVLKSI